MHAMPCTACIDVRLALSLMEDDRDLESFLNARILSGRIAVSPFRRFVGKVRAWTQALQTPAWCFCKPSAGTQVFSVADYHFLSRLTSCQ